MGTHRPSKHVAIDFGTKKMGLAWLEENEIKTLPFKVAQTEEVFRAISPAVAHTEIQGNLPEWFSKLAATHNIRLIKVKPNDVRIEGNGVTKGKWLKRAIVQQHTSCPNGDCYDAAYVLLNFLGRV